jgi:hypothetical protein
VTHHCRIGVNDKPAEDVPSSVALALNSVAVQLISTQQACGASTRRSCPPFAAACSQASRSSPPARTDNYTWVHC